MTHTYTLENSKNKNEYNVLCGDEIIGAIYARYSTFAANL